MLKQPLRKVLSFLLALAMLLTAPMGIVQAYAQEEQPMLPGIQGEASLGTSEEIKLGEAMDNDAPVLDADTPALDVDAPVLDADAPALDANSSALDANSSALDADPPVDTTPPEFTAGYPLYNLQQAGSRMLGIVISAQEEAYHYIVVLPDDAAAPNKSQVVAGTDGDNQPALKTQNSGSYKYASIQTSTFVPKHSTPYDVYVVLKDDAGNLSEPAKMDATSPIAANLIIGDGLHWYKDDPGSKQVRVAIYLQNIESGRKGKVYWVLLQNGAAPPSIEQIAAGTDGDGNAAVGEGSPEFDPLEGEGHFTVTGAAGNTLYDLYLVVGHTYFANPLAECTDVQMLQVTTPEDVVGEKVCAIGSTEYETLNAALDEVTNGSAATIRLLKSINSVQGIEIANKNITFDLGGFDININTTTSEGLKVTDGTVTLVGNGLFNVTGKNYGVWASGSTVTVTNASANDTNTTMTSTGMGVYAIGSSKVTVRQNAFGAAHGVKADNLGTEVTVEGNVSNSGSIKGAVYSLGQARVTVKGNATATVGYGVHAYGGGIITVEKDVSGSHIGAYAEDADAKITVKGNLISANNGAVIGNTLGSGSITVDGEIKGYGANPVPAVAYVTINGTQLAKAAGVSDPSKPGYFKYSASGKPGTVWVKDPAALVPGGPTGIAVWHNRSPLPTSNIINRVRYLDGEYIAVGEKGTLLTSSNGESWHKTIIGEGLDRLGGIAYSSANGKYVAVGHVDYIAGRIFTFDNGTGWHETAASPSHAFHDVAYGGGKFVAVGEAGKVLTSTDGENWTAHAVTYPNGKKTTLLSITYAADKGLFVASGMGSATDQHKGGIMTSPDGINWTVAYSDNMFTLWDITYGNGKSVAVGSTNNGGCRIITSTDCVTWAESKQLASYPSLYAVEWDGTRFIAAGTLESKGYTAVSTDGVNWSSNTLQSGTSPFRTLTHGAGRLVTMGGYGDIYTSDDAGTVWNRRTLGITKNLNDVAYNGSWLYVAVGDNGTIQTSPNGTDWTAQDSKTTDALNKVDYLNHLFVAVGKNGTILTSLDGVVWTKQSSGTDKELKGIAYGDGWYVAVGGDIKYDSSPVALYSTDGTSWNSVTTGFIGRPFVAVAYGDGVFLAMMSLGQAYKFQKDTDTGEFVVTRVVDLPGSGNYPNDIIYADDRFVVAGGYGEIGFTLTKGASWNYIGTKPDGSFHSVAYGGGNLVTVGELGMIKASADGGTTWLLQPSGLTLNHYDSSNYIRLKGVTAGNNCFVAVGENGLVLQSESFTVSADEAAHDVDVAARRLYFGHFQGSGSNSSSGIVSNMNLFTTWDEGTTVSWASSKPQYVATDGTVIRPAWTEGDQAVQLTATIQKGSAAVKKAFVVVVIMAEDTDINSVNSAMAALDFNTIRGNNIEAESINSNLILPTTGANGTAISWAISDPATIASNGTVTRPAEGEADVDVVLIATISKGTASLTKQFTVRVKALSAVPVPSHSVTVNGSYAGITGAGSYKQGAAVTIHAGSRSSYSFAGWTSSDGVAFVNASSTTTSFTMPDKDVVVTANWNYNGSTSPGGGPGSPGGSDSGGYAPFAPGITTDKKPDMPTTAKVSVSATVKEGVFSANITEQMVKDAIKAAQDAAKKSGKEIDGIVVEFGITNSGGYTSLNATVDAGAIDRLKEAGVKFIKIGSAVLDVTLDIGAIAEIDRQSSGTVGISAKLQTGLSKAAKALIGSRPVFDITVSYQKHDKTGYITTFGKGTVTLGIAYKAAAKEKTGNLYAVYVGKDGKPQLLANSSYNNGRLIFGRKSLSTYGVGYKAPAPAFGDTADHWAKDNIDFAASRDLISGTGITTFAPDIAITRAEFLMALGKLSGADMSSYKTSSFTDVKSSDPAMQYIEWAIKNKIVSDYGNKKFGPKDSITREQMAVMMVNYAKTTGYKLPVSRQAVTFSDNTKISTWAKDAVKAVQQTGIINGKTNNLFDPQGNATRAEASTVLHRFVELVIGEGTARGWVQNDSGQWQYIDLNGKASTGWSTIENTRYYFASDGTMVSGKWLEIDGKWYYFYTDGKLAVSTKVDGYEVDEKGVRSTR